MQDVRGKEGVDEDASSRRSSADSDSLFGDDEEPARDFNSRDNAERIRPVEAALAAPAIPGLYYCADFLSHEEQLKVIADVSRERYFDAGTGRDQAVLFGTPRDALTAEKGNSDGLPSWMSSLLTLVEQRTRALNLLDDESLNIVFAPMQSAPHSRQCILNLYAPGQGIKPHIDIPHRFLDGILLLSFGSGIAMDFAYCGDAHLSDKRPFSLYLQPGSLCILTGEARWEWTHGIAERNFDIVEDGIEDNMSYNVLRDLRLSITARWLNDQTCEECIAGPSLAEQLAQAELRTATS